MRDSVRIGPLAMAQLQAKAHEENDLLVWTIYDHPNDFPEAFVLRPHSSKRAAALSVHYDHRHLEMLRRACERMGLVCLSRQEGDDPCIVESWI